MPVVKPGGGRGQHATSRGCSVLYIELFPAYSWFLKQWGCCRRTHLFLVCRCCYWSRFCCWHSSTFSIVIFLDIGDLLDRVCVHVLFSFHSCFLRYLCVKSISGKLHVLDGMMHRDAYSNPSYKIACFSCRLLKEYTLLTLHWKWSA